MSATVTLEEAQGKLRELIARLSPAEELIITENQQPVARLVAAAKPAERPLGTLRGTVLYMAPDFDAPLEDFEEYME